MVKIEFETSRFHGTSGPRNIVLTLAELAMTIVDSIADKNDFQQDIVGPDGVKIGTMIYAE